MRGKLFVGQDVSDGLVKNNLGLHLFTGQCGPSGQRWLLINALEMHV